MQTIQSECRYCIDFYANDRLSLRGHLLIKTRLQFVEYGCNVPTGSHRLRLPNQLKKKDKSKVVS
jgi:hypothetical protein